MKLKKGMLIKTDYSGPYRIVEIERGCTCPLYLNEIDMDNPPDQPPHIHLTLSRPDGSGRFWLGHYVEETLQSLYKTYCGGKTMLDFDKITVLEPDHPVQMSLF